MITKAWFIVAVMSGVYTDGTKDIFIFQNPLEHRHFHSSTMCQKLIETNPYNLHMALLTQSGTTLPEQIMCVPSDTVNMFQDTGR